MHSNTTKQEAHKLRVRGKSYNEISDELGVAKSTLYSWLSDLQLSHKASERIANRVYEGSVKGLIKHNKRQTHLARQRATNNRKVGRSMITNMTEKDLLVLGAALYWGEGYKKAQFVKGRQVTHHPVSLSNSDPELVRVFLKFLRVCFHVQDSDISVEMHIYDHMNEEDMTQFWQEVTNLPHDNFKSVYYGASISSQRKRPYNRLPYGTVQIRVNSTPLYHQIMGLIGGVIEQS